MLNCSPALHALCRLSQALRAAQQRCEELEEALNSRSHVLEMLQQEVSSADQQKQVQILFSGLKHVGFETGSGYRFTDACRKHQDTPY